MTRKNKTLAARGMRATIKALERHRIRRFQAEQVRPHVWRIGIAYSPPPNRKRQSPTR